MQYGIFILLILRHSLRRSDCADSRGSRVPKGRRTKRNIDFVRVSLGETRRCDMTSEPATPVVGRPHDSGGTRTV
jgi:hypothetical protein